MAGYNIWGTDLMNYFTRECCGLGILQLFILMLLFSGCQQSETVAGNYKKNYTGDAAGAEPGDGDAQSADTGDEVADDEETPADDGEAAADAPADAPVAALQGDAAMGAAFLEQTGCTACHGNGAAFLDTEGRLLDPNVDTAEELAQVFTTATANPIHSMSALPTEPDIQVNIWQAAKDQVVPAAPAALR